MPEAARFGDGISHTAATTGFLAGSVAGAAAAYGAEALMAGAVAAGAVSGGVGFVVVLGIGALACWGLPKLGAALGRSVQSPPEGVITATCLNVFINGRAAASVLDPVTCHGGETIAEGSATVRINGRLAARHGDLTTTGGVIVTFSDNVIIGGPATAVAAVDDIPAWAQWTSAAIMVLPGLARTAAGLLTDAAGALTRTAEAGADASSGAGAEAAAGDSGAAGEAGEAGPAGGRGTEEDCSTCQKEGEPVNPATGAVFSECTDFVLPGPLPLVFRRVWTSTSTIVGDLGSGWHHSLDMALIERPQGRIALRLPDGRFTTFDRPAAEASSIDPVERLQLWSRGSGFVVTDYDGRIFEFSSVGQNRLRRLERIADLNGNAIRLLRDQTGGLTEIVDSAGRRLVVRRDRSDRIVAIEGPRPDGPGQCALVSFVYDGAGNLTGSRDANADGFDYGYDNHLLGWVRWPAGLVFRFRYDSLRRGQAARCIETVGDGGLFLRRLSYDEAERCTIVEDGTGVTRRYQWNAQGRVTAVTDGLGRRSTIDYDRLGHVTAETRPDGAARRYGYDARGRLVTVTEHDGATRRISYRQDGADGLVMALPVRIERVDGGMTRFGFDDRGNLVSHVSPGGAGRRYMRDTRGLTLVVQDALGPLQRFGWDEAGLLAWEGSARSARTGFSHDALGRLVATQRQGEQPVRYRRDAVGRLLELQRADGGRIMLTYDAEGQVTSHRDAAGQLTRWDYQGHPHPLRRIDADGSSRRYDYDADMRLVGLTNAKGERASLAYDEAGQLVEEIGFDGRRQSFAYDAAGFLSAQQDEEGRGASYTRDQLGRLLERRFADGSIRRYGYDVMGRLVRADNDARRLGFAYAPDGMLIEERQDDVVTRHVHDARGRRVSTILADGREIRLDWNLDDTLATMSCDDAVLTRFTRDVLGRETSRRSGMLTVASDYDPQGRLVRQLGRGSGQRPVLGRLYRYDEGDRLAAVDDVNTGRRDYSYDPCARLVGVAGDDPESFVFDPAGNIVGADGEARGIAIGDRLQVRGDAKFEYDRCGNRIRERRGAGGGVVVDYSYGPDNQLAGIDQSDRRGRRVTRFEYDALGRRVSKQSAVFAPAAANGLTSAPILTTSTSFLWDGDALLAETRNADALATLYLHEPDSFRPLATIRRVSPGGVTEAYHYHLDRIGTPQELTNDNGRVVWQGRARAWGSRAVAPRVAEIPQPLGFQGQYCDDETGLHYNRFRYYAPQQGCYIHQDPIRLLGGMNLCAYVSNPTELVDPFGLACKTGKTFQTYTKTDPNTGQVYSGRTSGVGTPEANVAARDAGHHITGDYGPAELDQSSSNPDAIRGREQQLIDANGGAQSAGGTSGNAIRGIGPNNPKGPGYISAANNEFGPP